MEKGTDRGKMHRKGSAFLALAVSGLLSFAWMCNACAQENTSAREDEKRIWRGPGYANTGSYAQNYPESGIKHNAVHRMVRMEVEDLKAGTRVEAENLAANGVDVYFSAHEISDALFARMYGKSYKENCSIPREELRYLKMLHCGPDGASYVGEMVCNREIAQEVLAVFRELYDCSYPIEKMVLVDDYDGDNLRSALDNNTSCFNFREAEGTSTSLSFHASGRAIDVNPKYNPYLWTDEAGIRQCGPEESWEYADRTKEFPYKITEDDPCKTIFEAHGFFWGGNFVYDKDYMHFSFGKRG